jgi:copper resistance protein C
VDKAPWLLPVLLIAAGIKCILLYSGVTFLVFGAIGSFLGVPWVLPAILFIVGLTAVAGTIYWRRMSARNECPIPMPIMRLMKRTKTPEVARLVKAEPTPNSTVEEAPGQLRLWFGTELQPTLSQVNVVDASGAKLPVTSSVDAAEPKCMTVAIPELAAGTYTVHWRTMSALNGQSAGGSFKFTVGEAVSVLRPVSAS